MAIKERAHRTAAGAAEAGESLAFGRAAEELELKRGELELAVLLEEVRTVAAAGTGRRRIPREEVARLRAAEGFPDALRERLRVVGTAQGAELLGISPARFTRLARVGCFSPVKFYVNRYRAVVWLYPAVDIEKFAKQQPRLLVGRTPEGLRTMLDAGEDWRARNWRSRRIGQLVRQTDDPWERAAVSAAVLAPDQLAEVVDDPYERAYLRKLRPALITVGAGAATVAYREVLETVIMADDPDEMLWHRISLSLSLDEARGLRPAPRPGATGGPAAVLDRIAGPVPAPGDTAAEARPDTQTWPETETQTETVTATATATRTEAVMRPDTETRTDTDTEAEPGPVRPRGLRRWLCRRG